MFKLHHTVGTHHRIPLGNFVQHGMIFADDGFGNYLHVDTVQYMDFYRSGL